MSDSQNPSSSARYSGFLAGVFSGISKLAIGHPFDTIKVRLQTSPPGLFNGPIDCCFKTIKHEGFTGFYKGASPPLVGWMFMDSIMLGSLTMYKSLLSQHLFHRPHHLERALTAAEQSNDLPPPSPPLPQLPLHGIMLAGALSGATVSFVAAPVEHIKARLQVQYSTDPSARAYSGPVDCARKIFARHGLAGMYKGLSATLIFRGFACVWWGTYDLFTRAMRDRTTLSPAAINFWAGGLSAQCFWIAAYPADVVKQRIMTDRLGTDAKYPHWKDAASSLWKEQGMRGFWRGFAPCFLRAFPANAVALMVFESVMGILN